MTLECPRCGFVQPTDRFCANCGLDIEHYKPKEPNLFIKIFKNSYFYIFIFANLLGLLSYYILTSKKPNEIVETPQAEVQVVKNPNLKAVPIARPSVPEDLITPTETAPVAAVAHEATVAEAQNIALEKLKDDNPLEDQKLKNIPLKVFFYETPKTQTAELLPSDRIVHNSDRLVAALHYSEIDDTKKGHTILATSISQDPTKPHSFITRSNEQQLLDTNFDIKFNPDLTGKVTIEIFMSLPNEGAGPDVINEQFEFKPERTPYLLVLAGLLPHRKLPIESSSLLSGTPLSILSSAEFQNNNTDFVMIISP